jgi:RimJ/RimL family protein N-acetyltransferase
VTASHAGHIESVYLRAFEPGDAENTHRWRHDWSLWNELGGTFRYFSLEGEREWVNAKQRHPSEVNLAVCLRDGRHIGGIALRDIDWVARRAELHLLIGEAEHRGRGHGSAAVRLLVRHAFEDLGLERLYLLVLARNGAAVRVYEKTGFVIEGRLRAHAFKAGAYEDVIVMGLLRRP